MKLSVPPLTRATVLAMVILSVSSLLMRYLRLQGIAAAVGAQPPAEGETAPWIPPFSSIQVPYLVLIPANFVMYPWVLATSSFVEQSIFEFFITGAALAFGGRYCERVWGGKNLAIFLAISAVVPNIVSLTVIYIAYMVTGRESLLMDVINGGIALQCAFLVAFKQLVPEHSIVLFSGVIKAQVKYLVIPIVLFYTVLGLITGHLSTVVLAWSGFFSAWIYLRFYSVSYVESVLPLSGSITAGEVQRSKVRGDASDTFALAKFFYPEPVSAAVAAVSNVVFTLLVAIHVCVPFNSDDVEAGNLNASLRTRSAAPSAAESADSDRRRALALRELGVRLETQVPK